MSEPVEFLRQRLDEDEWWAREASRLREQADQPTGVHWQWEDTSNDRVLALNPSQYEYVGDGCEVSLRSREQYPTQTVGNLPNFAIYSAEEVPTTVAGHIARHDPARVLAEVDAKRQLLAQYERLLTSQARHEQAVAELDADVAHEEETGRWEGAGSPDVRQRALRREGDYLSAMRPILEGLIKATAVVYATHPDYQEKWRP